MYLYTMLLRTGKGMTSLKGKNLDIEFELLKIKRKFTWGKIFEINLLTSEFNCLLKKLDMKGILQ